MSSYNIKTSRQLRMEHNVTIRVLDAKTGQVVQSHTGHNSATNSLLLGMGYYLTGEGVLNQGSGMLADYLPRYISLGTMGLCGQAQTDDGLPIDIGGVPPVDESEAAEVERYSKYMLERPGFGADGYDSNANNGRLAFGLGLPYTSYISSQTYVFGQVTIYQGAVYSCISQSPVTGTFNPEKWEFVEDLNLVGFELVTPTFARAKISYRNVVPEAYAETANSIDVVFSAMVSTGALAQFRGENDYIFISEAGLWSKPEWTSGGENGMLAGYRIVPPDTVNWDMNFAANRRLLQENILRVGINQVVQVIWKLQLRNADPEHDSVSEEAVYAQLLQQRWGN